MLIKTIIAKTLVLFLILASVGSGQDNFNELSFNLDSARVLNLCRWKYRLGNQNEWAEPGYDDSSWQVTGQTTITDDGRNRWYRIWLHLIGKQDDYDVLALYFWGVASAYEVYWDAIPVLKNGRVAEAKISEKPGSINTVVKLKRDWTEPGKHLLAIRLSNHHSQNAVQIHRIQLGYYAGIQSGFNRLLFSHLFSAGVFFLATMFSLALFLGSGKQWAFLLFAIYCFLNTSFSVVTFALLNWQVGMSYLPYINIFYYSAAPVAAIFLNIFLIFNFEIPRKVLHISINVILAMLILVVSGRSNLSLLPFYAIILLFYALKKKIPGSLIALLGLSIYAVLLILYYHSIIFYSYVIGEIFFIFCLTLAISRKIAEKNRQYQASKLRSARLEAELLKKNIQPHFLMNTLLSIMSWIEEEPKKAIKLIQALADEFRMINRIASKKEIPMYEEIRLCELHLELMGYRKDAHYELIRINTGNDDMVPPMIFHTLIENGLTHAYQSGENGTFKLTYTRTNNTSHYKLQNDGTLLEKLSQKSEDQLIDGMGIKYVKARLEESYPDKWKMTYGLIASHWEVNIFIEK